MKSFFENFPSELEEAASIDGMSTYGVFFKVVLPLSKAVVATMLLFYAVSFWNGWFGAFLYMDDPNLYPVTLYLRNLMAGVTSGTSIQGGSTHRRVPDRRQRAVRDDAPHGAAHHLPLPVHPEVLRVGRDARRGQAVVPSHPVKESHEVHQEARQCRRVGRRARARTHRGVLVGRRLVGRAVGQCQRRHPGRPARRRHGRLQGRHGLRRQRAGHVQRAVPRPPELPAEQGLAVLHAASPTRTR